MLAEREGEIRKDWSWKTEVNIDELRVKKMNAAYLTVYVVFPVFCVF